ncbi:hypothetical protein AB0L40_20730 [Patulibacter sp. NPDC049589]|uniref:hypothetical protein n=1 Tax=Patulibacter sp. NPDC049589 TaxID=3154731 RepID=UPI003438FDEF
MAAPTPSRDHVASRSCASPTFTVDSGATRSCIDLSYATRNLGIPESDLVEVLGGVDLADGTNIPAWTTPDPLDCQVLIGDTQRSGVMFALDPFVIENSDFLLGQQDFFEGFTSRSSAASHSS